MAFFRCGGGGQKSLILPSNPTIKLSPSDATIKVTWDTPTSEIEIKQYNVYISTSIPTKLEDMNMLAEVKGLEYTITELENNVKYYVVVTSVSIEDFENSSIKYIDSSTPISMALVICAANPLVSYDSGSTFTAISTKNLRKIIKGKDKYVAISSNSNSIYTSDDCEHWTLVSTPNFGDKTSIKSIVYAEDKDTYICAYEYSSGSDTYHTYIIKSKDLITWEGKQTIQSSYRWVALVYFSGTLFCATASSDWGYCSWKYSTDLINFSGSNNNEKFNATYIRDTQFTVADGELYSIGQHRSSTALRLCRWELKSGGGADYTFGINDIYTSAVLAYGNGIFVVAEYASILVEEKPVYYKDATGGFKQSNISVRAAAVTFANDRFYLASPNKFYESFDGATWTEISAIPETNYPYTLFCNK